MARPIEFKFQTTALQPSGKQYSANIVGVAPLPVWTDGEQVVSCWQMTWRERIAAVVFGRVWLSVLSGTTQPPAYITVEREYLKEEPTP